MLEKSREYFRTISNIIQETLNIQKNIDAWNYVEKSYDLKNIISEKIGRITFLNGS